MFGARRAEVELEEEIEAHLALLVDRFLARGMERTEAVYAARRQFGGLTEMKEGIRERRGFALMDELFQDGKYAFRQFRKSLGFMAVAVTVLALGVGANTAMFSVINATLLRPLPYPEPSRVTWIGETLKGNSTDEVTLTPDFLDWRDHNQVFSGMAAFNLLTRTLTNAGEAEQLHTAKASCTLLPILGVQPVIGRNFSQKEDQKGNDQVALISYGLWLKRFGGERRVLGRTLALDDRVYTIIGVLPASFYFPSSVAVDVITPLGKDEESEMKRGNGTTIVHDVVGRLQPGVTVHQARAQMEAIESHIAPPSFMSGAKLSVRVVPLQSQLVGSLRSSLGILLGAVGFLLLMGCANLSNLMLSRSIARQREIAIRSSLGASRSRLVRQMLIESMALAGLGCVAGLVLAFCTRGMFLRLLHQTIPGLNALPLDWRVLSFALSSACLSALLFGLGPALLSSGVQIAASLNTGGRRIWGRRGRQMWLNALASTQIAIAIVLLCGCGLMLRSFWSLRYRALRFPTDHLLTAQIHLGKAKYADSAAQISFVTRLLDYVRALPGVDGVAVGELPPGDGHATNGFAIEGRAPQPEGQKPVARSYAVDPTYFHVLRIPLLKGRVFSEDDRATTLPVAVVNETFARRNFPGENPIGKRLHLVRDAPWALIVGTVADVQTAGLAATPESVIYFPYLQVGSLTDDVGILVHTTFNPAYIEPALRKQVAKLDLQQPIAGIQSMDQRLDESVARPRLATILLTFFAALGVVLASVGLYGVMSLLVRGRLQEIGTRLAIGARPVDVLGMVLRRSLQITAIGIAGGVCCAFVLTRFLKSMLYNISVTDPVTIGGVITFLALVALAASCVPAYRASQVDPARTLRVE